MAQTFAHTASDAGVLSALRSAYETIKENRALKARYRQVLSELQCLDDRELIDLGFNRYDLRSIAYEHVYGS